jgi:hypothetical protein
MKMDLELNKKETMWSLCELYAEAGDEVPEIRRELWAMRRLSRLLINQAASQEEVERITNCLKGFVESTKVKFGDAK